MLRRPGADRTLRTFFRWADAEGYAVAPRILSLPKVRVPWKEPTLFHVSQLRDILAACNPRMPQEGLAVLTEVFAFALLVVMNAATSAPVMVASSVREMMSSMRV